MKPDLEMISAPCEEMALNHVDKDWIKSAVQDAIRDHYKGTRARVQAWLPTGALVAIILFALTQWNTYTIFRTHTEDRLAVIEGRLLKAEASRSPHSVLSELETMPPREFAAALPALRVVAEQPSVDVKPSKETLSEVATKLRAAPEASREYWPTALQFIQFASSGLSPDVPPSNAPATVLSEVKFDPSDQQPFTHSRVILDHGTIQGTRFEDCRIVFTTNPVFLKNVSFINCVFEFPKAEIPNPYLMRVGRQLLAEDLQKVVLTIG